MTRVAKEFDFHAAHVLPNHKGQCSRFHGHTYKLRVIVEGVVRPVDTASDEGMVVDFEVLKNIYKTYVEPRVEHQNLNETLVAEGHVLVSSCELMARWIADQFVAGLAWHQREGALRVTDTPARIAEVRLWETPTSWAEVIL